MDHVHEMKKIAEEYVVLMLKGFYKTYEDTRKKYVFLCDCGKEEMIYRFPWDSLLFEKYKIYETN